jgi:ribosomal protein S18 acetylase RimI-like enzyme
VVCSAEEPDRVVGYFSIPAAVEQGNALPSAKLRRGMPEQVPPLLIGRLAVDAEWQGRGLGSALLADALRRSFTASEIAGVRGVVAHAIDEAAVAFYERHGFIDRRSASVSCRCRSKRFGPWSADYSLADQLGSSALGLNLPSLAGIAA